jgi:copper chaperone CopZ
MKSRFMHLVAVFTALAFWIGASSQSGGAANDQEPNQPHTPTLIFYISGAQGPHDADALGASVQKLQSAKVVDFNADRGYVRVRFDSHVVSYHQVAQATAEAGKTLGKTYDPYLVLP